MSSTNNTAILATLNAAAREYGSFRIEVRNLSDLDCFKEDPSKPAAACWLDNILYIDSRTEGGPDFEIALKFLAEQVAVHAAQRAADDLPLLGIEEAWGE